MNQFEQFREKCAKICDEYREAMIKENEEDLYWFGKVKNAYGAASGAKELAKKIRALPLPEISDTPVAYIRCRYAQSLNTNGHCDGHEWMEVCNEGEQGEDGEPAFPVYATPRPYIPQDIRETVEENEALLQENKRLATVEYCFNEWLEKTDWVQKTVQAHELGMHRADVLKNRIDTLREVLKETLDFLEYNADYYPESGADDHNTIEKIKAVLGMKDTKSETRVTMSAINNEGAA